MEICEKYKDVVEKLTQMRDQFMLVCHDETENDTMAYLWINYPSGLEFIGIVIDAFMEYSVPSLGRDKVIQNIRSVVNYAIDRNKTQIKEDLQKMPDGLEEALTQDEKK